MPMKPHEQAELLCLPRLIERERDPELRRLRDRSLKEIDSMIQKSTGLRTFTMADIRSWQPCYDPARHLPETWRGTAVDLLKNDGIPHADRFWAVLRTEVTSKRVMRLFAVWWWSAARSAQNKQREKLIEMLLVEGRERLKRNARIRSKRKKAA